MVTTNAFILRRYNIRDADRIYTLYTERLGKIEAIATGVRKIKSKLAAHLEPCGLVRVTLVHGRRGWRLVNAKREESFFALHTDLERFAMAMTALETIDALTKVEAPDAHIFQLLHALFSAGISSAIRTRELLDPFLYRLLDLLGYRPLPQEFATALLESPVFTEHLHYPLRSSQYFSHS